MRDRDRPATPGAAGKAAAREDRLARALRENLRKRKQQARDRDAQETPRAGGDSQQGKA